ncbi:cellulase family glycosylhydrolase [Streptomyces sodiiphilus]|uniref:Endoglucanase n=1 Tax=Streptomyces sodiiphilus TaxID=226217 RepID=A0ABP5A3L8_9ACTN
MAAFAAAIGLLLSLLGLSRTAQAEPAAAATGIHVQDGRVLESNGNDFVMRGVNHPHTWFTGRTAALGHIKELGANTVRVVLSSGDRWTRNDVSDVRNIVSLCKQHRLICVLEVHDTTGYGEEGAAASLDQAADYWISIRDALRGEEDYVVINIGNEPHGNTGYERWAADTRGAIVKLRQAGFEHALMVDAPNWGQDWTHTMRDNARSVFDADPQGNTMFSIHMYGVFEQESVIRSYLTHFVNAGLPILVGEFGHYHSDGDPDEDAILRITRELGLGYLGWSWSGNSGGVDYLDMVRDFDPASLTDWGRRIFHGPDGIGDTSREATVYGSGGGEDTTPPTTPGTPVASDITATSVTLSWAASTDNVGVTGYDVVRVATGSETVVATSAGNSATVTGLTPQTGYSFAVYARDAAGNRSSRSPAVNVTTADGGGQEPGDAACSVAYRVVGEWPGGFQGEVVISNTGTSALDGWTLGWSFPAGQTVTNLWGGTVTQSGSAVTVRPASYTSVIPVSGSVTLGFTGTWTGSNTSPDTFTLDNSACTTA